MITFLPLGALNRVDVDTNPLGVRRPLYQISADQPLLGLGADVVGKREGDNLDLTWRTGNLRGEDRRAWAFLPFDRAAGTVDLSRAYATSWIAIKLQRKPGRLALTFWDDHHQNGRPVSIADKGLYIAEEDVWYVPMDTAVGLRLDLAKGLAVGEIGDPSSTSAKIVLPIKLISTGRIDNRPLGVKSRAENIMIGVQPKKVVKDLKDYGFGCHWDLCEGMPEAEDTTAPVAFYRDMGFNMVRGNAPLVRADDRAAQLREIPKRSWPKLQPVPFSDMISLYRRAGFDEIATILPFNEYFMEPAATRPPLAEWSRNLPSTASYLKSRGFLTTRYYELGNEIWSKDNRMGGAATGEKGEYIGAQIPAAVRLYAKQIKAADPRAKFMASYGGFDSSWPYLMKVLPDLDVINFSFYGWQFSYEKFRHSNVLGIGEAEKRLRAVDPAAADRIMFGATEYAPHDWAPDFDSEGWMTVNDLGHALWGFSQAAESLTDPRMAFACQWTVRWLWQHEDRQTGKQVWKPYDVYPSTDWDLLTFDKRRTALSRALKLLGRNRLDQVVATSTNESPEVMSFAVRSRDGKNLNVFILNKDYGAKNVTLRLSGSRPRSMRAQVFTGRGLDDPEASVRTLGSQPRLSGDGATLVVPELSVTMLSIRLR
jgi:hypothetical protein